MQFVAQIDPPRIKVQVPSAVNQCCNTTSKACRLDGNKEHWAWRTVPGPSSSPHHLIELTWPDDTGKKSQDGNPSEVAPQEAGSYDRLMCA